MAPLLTQAFFWLGRAALCRLLPMLKLIPSDLRSLSAALPAGPVLISPGLPGKDEIADLLPRIQVYPGPAKRFRSDGRIGPRLRFSLDQPES